MKAGHTAVVGLFRSILGDQYVLNDPVEISYFCQDYFQRGKPAIAVLRPNDASELIRVVKVATESGLAVYPRGGGYSYTSGYLATVPGIVIDLRRMNRILKIDPTDMYVTVEPGCTWATLYKSLEAHGLRTPFFGPFSGLNATVGGSISQGAISLGSGKYGVSSESVLDLEIVTAAGDLVSTGVSGQPHHQPFFRNYGPDITGLFCSDCGALGIKASVTLRLVRRPSHTLGLSFGFDAFETMASAAAAIARHGIVADNMGMPAAHLAANMMDSSRLQDLRVLWKIARASENFADGVLRTGRIAFKGRRFLRNFEYVFNVVVEGATRRLVNAQAEIARGAVGTSGVEISNAVPTAMRADPFLDHDMLSPSGQRQLPPSTIVPFSAAAPLVRELKLAVDGLRNEMQPFDMSVTPVLATVGTTGCLIEPVIAWNDQPDDFHRKHSSDRVLRLAQDYEDAPEARRLAARVRRIFIEIAYQHGGVHLQIGKVYPYLKGRDPVAVELVSAVKQRVDPQGLLNPGALGLPL